MTRLRPWQRRLRALVVATSCAVVVLAAVQFVALVRHIRTVPDTAVTGGVAAVPAMLAGQAPERARSIKAYSGYGTWLDVYDLVPSGKASATPEVTLEAVDEMARSGVKTLYLQAAQVAERSPSLLLDRSLLGQVLVRARRHGMHVVGWYLPKFTDLERDLAHLRAIADFQVLGHRFDGVAVDIEWTAGIVDPAERSNKLVELSRRLRSGVGPEPLGAIVLPPVQLEVVNPGKWPDFPWRRLADLYDVWLPMGYWTERRADSGYKDGRAYTEENVERLRKNLDDADAAVHVIGGIGDDITPHQAARFASAVTETEAVGGSIYDWRTTANELHEHLARPINRQLQR